MKEELLKSIKSIGVDKWRSFYDDLFCNYDLDSKMINKLQKKGFIIKVEDHYGGEGQGNEYWSVFSVTHEDKVSFFKIDGYYASYEGASLTDDIFDFYEVKKVPVQAYEWETMENS